MKDSPYSETVEQNFHPSERGFFLSSEAVEAMEGHPDAFMIWVMFMIPRKPEWVFRREHLRARAGISKRKWDAATRTLYNLGLLSNKIVTDPKTGRITGRIFQAYSWAGRFSPEEKRRSEKQGKSSKKPNDSNSDSVSPKTHHTENETLYFISRGGEGGIGGLATPKNEVKIEEEIMTPELAQKHRDRFLSCFPGRKTFQLFDDTPSKRKHMARVIHDKTALLEDLNLCGAGVFLTINETNGKGRKTEDIERVRAVFVDLDGSDVQPVLEHMPHLVVESSPGKYHGYWLVKDFPLEGFRQVQKRLIEKFSGDKAVHDLPRVMRIPGYWHQKGEPFMSRIVFRTGEPPLSYAEICAKFPPPPVKKWSSPKRQHRVNDRGEYTGPYGTSAGGRNIGLARFIGGMIKRNHDFAHIEQEAERWGQACSPPMEQSEIHAVVQSLSRYSS